jgi:RNA polymerase sigma-70 factor (ECF subfamily)
MAEFPETLTDGELARRYLVGEEWAFEALVDRYMKPLFNFAYRYLGDQDEAADIVQETFVRLYRNLTKLDLQQPLKPWLYRTARNLCLNRIPQRLRHQSMEGDTILQMPDGAAGPDDQIDLHDLQASVQEAVRRLPPMYRDVVTLYYFAELSVQEVAAILGLPEATVKTRLFRARERLKRWLSRLHET